MLFLTSHLLDLQSTYDVFWSVGALREIKREVFAFETPEILELMLCSKVATSPVYLFKLKCIQIKLEIHFSSHISHI